jgi:hypothetical protein
MQLPPESKLVPETNIGVTAKAEMLSSTVVQPLQADYSLAYQEPLKQTQ